MKVKYLTLLELLIVVAIIGILVTLLLPSLSRAREKSRRAVCTSNQRQIGIALASYEDTYKTYPLGNASAPGGGGIGIDSTYRRPNDMNYPFGLAFLRLSGILSSGKVFYCPSWKHPDQQFDKVAFHGGWPNNDQIRPWPLMNQIGISYHYRGTFRYAGSPTTWNPPRPTQEVPAKTAVNSDHWVRRLGILWGQTYGHYDAYITLYLDGHVEPVYDIKGKNMSAIQTNATYNLDYVFQEDTVWKLFFNKR